MRTVFERFVAGGLLAISAAASAAGGDIAVRVVDAKGRPVADAVVSAVPATGAPPRAGDAQATIDQIDAEFVPHVIAVRTGTRVSFPNHDATRHHVYSFSPPKKFELPLYAGTPAEPVTFDAPGLVVLGCNIHDWMLGYVYVLDTPWFATTGVEGTAVLRALPAGDYSVRVQHPRAKTEPGPVRAEAGAAPPPIEFRLDLKPDFRRPRGRAGEAGYR